MATWIFQDNPEQFDIDGYLASTSVILWTVRQPHFANRMEPGDRVYFWRAGAGDPKRAGVMASGWIETPPAQMAVDAAALPYQRSRELDPLFLRVQVGIDRVANAKELIRREWLKDDPVLSDLRILKLATETNFLLSDAHAERLARLWANTGRDWTHDESMAGLWAFARTLGGEISKKNGPVPDVALLIGRAVSGVYNKVMNFRALDPTDTRKGFDSTSEVDIRVWDEYFDRSSRQLDRTRLYRDFETAWLNSSVPQATTTTASLEPPLREQGYEPNPLIRKRIEERAVAMAIAHYQGLGYAVENVGHVESYDLRCTLGGAEVRVEVKGTRGSGQAIHLTANEVAHALDGSGYRTDLFVVSAIEVVSSAGEVVASGGVHRLIEGWRPEPGLLTPTQYRYRLPSQPHD
jgi:hypothetical protein